MSKKFCAGDLVEVRSKEEILATLDPKGQLKGLPFMPEMFQHCGKRLRVFKRAHKTCDTVNGTGGRWMGDAIHLEGIRCGGEGHGGCQAECLIFWWQDWLKKVPESEASSAAAPAGARPAASAAVKAPGCTEQEVMAGTMSPDSVPGDPTYVCQATQLPQYTTLLHFWDVRQYVEDYLSGNVGLWRMFCGFTYRLFFKISQSRIGKFFRVVAFYDRFQKLLGSHKFPAKTGRVPAGEKTPVLTLGLQPGEMVRVKSHDEILDTVNASNRNQGLSFDPEMVPYCGGTYRVTKRLSKIVNERTGKMHTLKNESIMLENVCCQSKYSGRRMFCPRAIYPFWKEIWLERVGEQSAGQPPASAPCSPR